MRNNSVLSLDVGDRRVGVAVASRQTGLAQPLTAIDRLGEDIWQALDKLLAENQVDTVVMGLPRGMEGQETAQTSVVRQFAHEFKQHFSHPLHFQDEAMTSHIAEEELRSRGVVYNKGDVDALAATYILSDYLKENPLEAA